VLGHFFSPSSIAVIGASRTPGKVGHDLLKNMLSFGFAGKIYPVNPGAEEVLGLKCYPSVLDIESPVDLAVVVVPPPSVLETIEQCGEKHVDSAVIITAGFKETGPEGARLERELAKLARQYGVRILGPNCVGLIDTRTRLNASFASGVPLAGPIGFFSQSGALCVAILDWALEAKIGFSKFVSLGNKADISEIELTQALGQDDETKVILGYLESIQDGGRFMAVAREVSARKPLIVFKSGVTSAGAKAASSHTGSLAGSDRAFEAAFKQTGVIRANSVEELFNYALAFAHQPLPRGPNLAIITNSGGPGIIAADAADRTDLELVSLQKKTVDELRTFLPKMASFYNPVDILGDASAERYRRALELVAADAKIDAVLVLLTPVAVVDVKQVARSVCEVASRSPKPIFTSFMGGVGVSEGRQLLLDAGVPSYEYPEEAIGSLEAMLKRQRWLSRPSEVYPRLEVGRDRVAEILAAVRNDGRISLSEEEAHEVLRAYGFRLPREEMARTSDEAVAVAERIGYPVVLKLISPQVVHKSDVGGVVANVHSADEVRDAFFEMTSAARRMVSKLYIAGVLVQEMIQGAREVILGLSRDLQFGPLIMFGLGGIYVEVLKDVAFRVAPLSREEADDIIREIHALPLLRGVRGEPPADFRALREALLRLSQLAVDFPQIVEADINPLLVLGPGQGTVAADVRFTISGE
jgi:acetyl coenzyme A synthetase (ADP forming)-like protein